MLQTQPSFEFVFVARDHLPLMQSTGQYKHLGNVLVIPTDCIDKWWAKFQHKAKLEPYFWLKNKA